MNAIVRTAIAALACICIFFIGGCDLLLSPSQRVERARTHIAQSEYRAALVELKNALSKEPQSAEARLLIAEVALWLGDASSAARELERVPPEHDPAAASQLRARIDLALGRHKQVLEQTEDAGGPMDRKYALLYRGRALLGLGDPVAAQATLREALALDAMFVPASVALADSLAAQGQVAEALELSGRLVRDHSNSAAAWFAHGRLLARSDATAAREALARARELSAKQLDVTTQVELVAALTELQLSAGLIKEARESSSALDRLAPGSPIALLMSSRLAMAENDYSTASAELRRVVNAAPRFAQARFLLGAALFAQGNLEQASQELSSVVAQAPELVEARQLLAQVRMRLNDPDGALRVLVPALESEPDSVTGVHALLGAARAQLSSSGRAIEVLEQELSKNPNNSALQVELAGAYLQGGASRQALDLLRTRDAQDLDARGAAILLQSLSDVEGPAAARLRAENLLSLRANDPRIVSVASAFLAHIGDVEAARAHLARALKTSPASSELRLTLARLEWHLGARNAAREMLETLLARDPQNEDARLMLAELNLAMGNTQAGEKELEQLRTDDERAVQPRLLLARVALARNEVRRAEGLINEVLQKRERDHVAHATAAGLYLAHGRYAQAIPLYRRVVELNASDVSSWMQLGRAQLALGEHAAARESLERARSLRPGWPAAEGALAFLDLQTGQVDAALARVKELKAQRPKDADVLMLEGQVYASLRRYGEASAAFDQAMSIRPARALALSAYQTRIAAQHSEPAQPLERWLTQQPDDLGVRNLLADAYMRAGVNDRAIAQYELILQREPKHAATLNNLAWLYHERNDSRALQLARRAHAAAPNSPAVIDTLGWILVATGELDEGLQLLERASQLASNSPEIGYHYAFALSRAGSTQDARQRLEQLLREHEDFPTRTEAERLLSRLTGSATSGVQ